MVSAIQSNKLIVVLVSIAVVMAIDFLHIFLGKKRKVGTGLINANGKAGREHLRLSFLCGEKRGGLFAHPLCCEILI